MSFLDGEVKSLSRIYAALYQEILASEERIGLLSSDPSVVKTWGLTGEPLQVLIGSDNECYAFDLEEMEDMDTTCRGTELPIAVWEKCAQELTIAPCVDSNALEINLLPDIGSAVIGTFFSLEQKIRKIALDRNFDFAMGAGHWHLSIMDAGRKDGSAVMKKDNGYSDFACLLAKNLAELQCLCPCLFFRPSRSEKRNAQYTKYTGISFRDSRDKAIQLNGETYHNGSPMFEMRVAHLAPFVPVMMMLHTIERSLKNEIVCADDFDHANTSLGLDHVFVRGKGCYQEYIEMTRRTGYLDRHFPHLRNDLLILSVQSYLDFIRDPTWSTMYGKLDRVEALQQVQKAYPVGVFDGDELWGGGSRNAVPLRPDVLSPVLARIEKPVRVIDQQLIEDIRWVRAVSMRRSECRSPYASALDVLSMG